MTKEKLYKAPAPSYAVSVRRMDADAPYLRRYIQLRSEMDDVLKTLHRKHSGDIVRAIRLKGMRHGSVYIWRFDGYRAVALNTYNQFATGKRVPKEAKDLYGEMSIE